MNTISKTVVCFLVCAMGIIPNCSASAFEHMTKDNSEYFLDASYTESRIRKLGISDTEKMLSRLFTDNAAKKWRSHVETHFSKEQIKDFFIGAVLLRGAVSERAAICGFYNPFWDTILITESISEKVMVEEKTIEVRKVNDYLLLNGRTFRNENEKPNSSARALASPEASISLTLCELFSKTKIRFNKLYANINYPLLINDEDDRSMTNISEIQSVSALRLKMASDFIKNKENYTEAWKLVPLLQHGKLASFNYLFTSPLAQIMSESFSKLPKVIRKNFEPYAYYPDQNGTRTRCYVYVNSSFPRLFAVMLLGNGIGNTTFEWYDFAYADEIIGAFNNAMGRK